MSAATRARFVLAVGAAMTIAVAGRPWIETEAWAEGRTPIADVPCPGCRVSFAPYREPDPPSPKPLLVLLHGDWGAGPSELLAAWEKAAAKRDLVVLALRCPVELGCKGSFWQWNGDPAWITQQVDGFERRRGPAHAAVAIDRKRMYLAGWSGGASYVGMRAQSFQQTFAAIVYHGGGVPPAGPCAPASAAPAPAFFLVGDANPLHALALGLKRQNEQCGIDVTWKVLPGADHATEWKALETSAGPIVDWMLTKRRP